MWPCSHIADLASMLLHHFSSPKPCHIFPQGCWSLFVFLSTIIFNFIIIIPFHFFSLYVSLLDWLFVFGVSFLVFRLELDFSFCISLFYRSRLSAPTLYWHHSTKQPHWPSFVVIRWTLIKLSYVNLSPWYVALLSSSSSPLVFQLPNITIIIKNGTKRKNHIAITILLDSRWE